MLLTMTTEVNAMPAAGAGPAAALIDDLSAVGGADHDFEVHVAAGQVWLVIPDRADCRAMYPEHARVLAAALEQVAVRGEEKKIFLAEDASLSICRKGTDAVVIREDMTNAPGSIGVTVSPETAYAYARRIREAADLASRTLWSRHAA